MTAQPDHATEAAELLANDRADVATAHALLAIHEQLRVANVIALEDQRIEAVQSNGHYWGPSLVWDPPATESSNNTINPAIADLLGINREDNDHA